MIQTKPNHAFILAAGKGTRLRPYTNDTPKPMVLVGDKPILKHTLEKLEEIGVKNITINLHYLGDRITKYFKDRKSSNITFSHEKEILDTGGGVKYALDTMENEPFYLINGDALWEDNSQTNALLDLSEAWDPTKMDILLLLQPIEKMTLTSGVGDYNLNDHGTITRTADKTGQYMFTGIRIVHPKVFENKPNRAFSFLECMDKAQEQRRLYGIEYQGEWYHISTPDELEKVNKAFSDIKHVQVNKG